MRLITVSELLMAGPTAETADASGQRGPAGDERVAARLSFYATVGFMGLLAASVAAWVCFLFDSPVWFTLSSFAVVVGYLARRETIRGVIGSACYVIGALLVVVPVVDLLSLPAGYPTDPTSRLAAFLVGQFVFGVLGLSTLGVGWLFRRGSARNASPVTWEELRQARRASNYRLF